MHPSPGQSSDSGGSDESSIKDNGDHCVLALEGGVDGCDDGVADDTNCPSILFAQSLKSYHEGEHVCAYNHDLLHNKCHPESDEYNPELNLNIIAKELFKFQELWKNRGLLLESLINFGRIQGFKPIIKRNTIQCSRSGVKDYKRCFHNGPLKVDCPFVLKLKAVYNYKSMPDNPTPNSKPRTRPDYDRETFVKEGNYEHGGGCSPSAKNLMMATFRSVGRPKKRKEVDETPNSTAKSAKSSTATNHSEALSEVTASVAIPSAAPTSIQKANNRMEIMSAVDFVLNNPNFGANDVNHFKFNVWELAQNLVRKKRAHINEEC